MHCTDPRTVGFKADGKTISWSQKDYSKEFATFQLPCGQCLECRLDYARQWAIRCVHEAQMHPNNCFITLTYSDDHLKSDKLDYRDFQLFMKRLRKKLPGQEIGLFVTGEYGDQTKRPHWHAIIFNWQPPDMVFLRENERGDKIFKSTLLDQLWGKNDPDKKPNEIGSVTLDSAGYCARYAAKKLTHGKDQEHEYNPISKKSQKHAIGKRWLEKYYFTDCFAQGYIILKDGTQVPIPRYYEKWFKKHKPTEWAHYVTHIKQQKIENAESRDQKEKLIEKKQNEERRSRGETHVITKKQSKKIILEQKFKQLQKHLKL